MFPVESVPSAHVLLNMFEKGLFPACAFFNTVQHAYFTLFCTDYMKEDELIVIAPCNQKCYLQVYLGFARSSAVLWDSDPH